MSQIRVSFDYRIWMRDVASCYDFGMILLWFDFIIFLTKSHYCMNLYYWNQVIFAVFLFIYLKNKTKKQAIYINQLTYLLSFLQLISLKNKTAINLFFI
jgi:hypothetical protein